MTTRQGTHFWTMTLQCMEDDRPAVTGCNGHWTPKPGQTRYDVFQEIRAEIENSQPQTRGGVVVAFDIQPNALDSGMAPAPVGMEYRLVTRERSGNRLAETPWIEIPDPQWTAEHTHHFETGATVHPSDHTPANFARQSGAQATDIEWRVKP